jgi:hypothetical protein
MLSFSKGAVVALVLMACAHSAAAARPAPTTLYDVISQLPEVSKVFAKVRGWLHGQDVPRGARSAPSNAVVTRLVGGQSGCGYLVMVTCSGAVGRR